MSTERITNGMSEIPTEKRCTGCHQIKPMEDFGKRQGGKYGRNPRCRDCLRAWRATPEYRASARRTAKRHYDQRAGTARQQREAAEAEWFDTEGHAARICRSCGRKLRLDAYSYFSKKEGIRRQVCKFCHRAKDKEYTSRPDVAEHRRQVARAWQSENGRNPAWRYAYQRRQSGMPETEIDYSISVDSLLAAYGNTCTYCGIEMTAPYPCSPTSRSVSHLVPPSAPESTHTRSNVVLACHSCRGAKGAQTLEEYAGTERAAQIRARVAERAEVVS